MPPTIFEDALTRPDLFHWFGVAEPKFDVWLNALPLRVHPGLVSFWRRTGGGDCFESETLLGPLATGAGDNVIEISEFYWSKGLLRNLLVFHTGICLSASSVDMRHHRNRLVILKPETFEVAQWFDTFNAWYQNTLRSEYAERYGLPI